MMEITSGIDMVEIERFRSLTHEIRSRFLHRVFTPEEITASAGRDESLAARFAAKEAAAKALGCGIGKVSWQDIETRLDENGKPTLILSGAALETANHLAWKSWSISISHTREYAIAIVSALYTVE